MSIFINSSPNQYMDIIKLTEKNIDKEHICCAFTSKDCASGYAMKKDWLKTAFKNAYTFRKLDAKAKVFIEYTPLEHSWLPISEGNFMVINCFWVSGRYKGKGYGKKLLEQCIVDAKQAGLDGVISITGEKKRPYMNDPKFLAHHGFECYDEAAPYFKLWGMKFNDSAKFPRFLDSARTGKCEVSEGIRAYYSNTCPFTEFYIRTFLQNYADQKGIPLEIHHITSREEGRAMPIPWVICSVFYKGEFVTLDVKADKHLDKHLATL